MIRVLCVDDNELVGSALRVKLVGAGIEWLGLLTNANDLVPEVLAREPEVVLLDVDMPGRSALAAMEEAVRAYPKARFIVLSGHVRRDLVDRAFEAGAWGYLSKTEGADSVVEAVQRVHRGEMAMSGDVEAVLGS